MKVKYRLSALLLALCLLLGLCPAALAAGNALDLSRSTAAPGESFVVSFTQPKDQTVSSLSLSISFDKTVLELTGVAPAPYANIQPDKAGANSYGVVSIAYTDPSLDANTAVAAGTVLLSLTFKVKMSAPLGPTDVTVADYRTEGGYDPMTYMMENITPSDAEVGPKTKTVTVGMGLPSVPVTGVTLNKTALTLSVGASETLTASVAPSDATDKSVTWSSSNTSVATADASGKVTAVAEGTATITVKTSDGGYTASCVVTVAGEAPSGALALSKTSLFHGETLEVSFTQPKAQTVSSISLSVSFDNAVFELTEIAPAPYANLQPDKAGANGAGLVSIAYTDPSLDANTAVAAGTVLLKLSFLVKDGAADGATAISVTDYMVEGAYDPMSYMNENITPSEAEVGPRTRSVTILNGSFKAVTGVTLDQTALTLAEGETGTLTAAVAPADASDKSVSWVSSAPAVAEVDASGKVTAKAAGTATVTVKTADGGFTANCTVTVTHKLTKTDEVPATCTAAGTKAYWTCSVCGKRFADAEGATEIAAPEAIPALGHNWGAWTVKTPATETTEGVEERTCSRCGEKETRTIPKLPAHTPGDVNGDGKVNDRDAILLFRYAAGSAVTVVETALDVNNDGTINFEDAWYLFRYVSGEALTIW